MGPSQLAASSRRHRHESHCQSPPTDLACLKGPKPWELRLSDEENPSANAVTTRPGIAPKVNRMKIWTLTIIAILLAGMAMILLRLIPPDRLVLAAGPQNGAYTQIAEQYRQVLARDGITLEIVETAGSVENAELIRNRQVDAALIQGGIQVADPDIQAIGTVFNEPMVFLSRKDAIVPGNPARWTGLRISSGQPGSGTAMAFRDFQTAAGIDPTANTHLTLSYRDAIKALSDGTIDLAVFVATIDAPYLISAYTQPSIRLVPLDYTEALSRRLEYASTVVVPPGAISLVPAIPPSPRRLLALGARLAITPELHPALVNRLTMAARELHGKRDIITNPGEFPSVAGAAMPVNNAARLLILEGPSAWHDWLPYWMAAQFNRVLLLVLPFLFIVLPLIRAIPGLYAFIMRWKIWQFYPEIRLIESELSASPDPSNLGSMDARLVNLDERLAKVKIPVAYRQTAYDARIHIEMVRRRIAKMRAGDLPD